MEIKHKEPPTAGIVFISFIKDICTFYVVNETFLKQENDWYKVCELEAKRYKKKVTDIKVDDIYLVKYKLDKKYYRALLQEINSNDCKVKFIDYGNELNVLEEQLVECPQMLKSCKPRAKECAFYNILWNSNKEKNKALACVAGERRLFQMFTIARVKNVSLIDLITLEQRRFSVRDFLLSYNIGNVVQTYETRAVGVIQGIVEEMKANNIQQENINKRSLKLGEWYDVNVRHVHSPDEFYVCETKDLDAEAQLQRQMKEYYAVLTPEMFGPIETRSYYAIQLNDNSWQRIEVLEKSNDDGSCSILFIDTGLIQKISVSKLLLLNEKFYDFKRLAIKCSMANISPIDADCWSMQAIKLLKYALEFVQDSETVRIKVENICKIDRSAEVTVEIIKESIKIDVNMSLVHFNHAMSEKHQAPFAKNVDYMIKVEELKPVSINILSINEAKPDEFYFAYKRFSRGIENLHVFIQIRMRTSIRTLINWKKGDVCMVNFREQLGKPTLYWYRGIIEQINLNIRKCCVFLCDRGTRIVCTLSMLRECPIEFKDIPNSCHRGHLPCSPLNSSQWSLESIKMFRSYLQDFNTFSITILDNNSEVNSICVLLWGQKLNEWLEEHKGYYNILKELASAEIVEADDLFKQKNTFSVDFASDEVDVSVEDKPTLKLPKIETGEVMVLEYKVKLIKRRIKNWLPANQSKKVFVGIPTNVDNNSIISMTDEAEDYYLECIKNILNKYYHYNTQSIAHNFKIGEPCIARYLVDGLYYRGSIVAVHPLSYDVLFIDYGNIEKCNESDIFNKVMCSEIPNMSYKFILPSVNIRIDQNVRELNDALHSLIVGKVCNISVSDDNDSFDSEQDLTPVCTITVDNTIINSLRDVNSYIK